MSYPRVDQIFNSSTQYESGPSSPHGTESTWDFSTPLSGLSRATSPFLMLTPDRSRAPTPEVQEPDQFPLHHYHRQYYFEDANDEFIVSGKTIPIIQRLTFHTGRRIPFSRLSFHLRLTNNCIPKKQLDLSHSVGRRNLIRVRLPVGLPLRWVRDPISLLYVPG